MVPAEASQVTGDYFEQRFTDVFRSDRPARYKGTDHETMNDRLGLRSEPSVGHPFTPRHLADGIVPQSQKAEQLRFVTCRAEQIFPAFVLWLNRRIPLRVLVQLSPPSSGRDI